MSEDQSSRTLYVGNLSPMVTEQFLITLFGQIAECKSCKIIYEPGNDPYAFVELADSQTAGSVLTAMNKRNCFGKEIKVNWATTSGGQQTKVDTSKSYHIFVGDLATDIDQQTLRDAFAPYGEISDVKIMKDPQTLVHKGYGFVSFIDKLNAENAIAAMNGQWLGSRKIRTNWAARKVQPGGDVTLGSNGMSNGTNSKYGQKLDYNDVWTRSSDTNTTVYCGGISNLTDDHVRQIFGVYGQITGIHPFPDRGYSFVRFSTKESACAAICGVHGMEVNGSVAKCSWGKESVDMSMGGSSSNNSNNNNNNNSNSGYNNNANSVATAAAALAAMQQQQNNPSQNSSWGGASGAAQQNSNQWAAAANNYQWAAAAGYPQNAYWQYSAYQNQAMMAQQGWGMMPNQNGQAQPSSSAPPPPPPPTSS